MAYESTPYIVWDRGTAADGEYFRDEFQRIYDNFNEFINTAGDEFQIDNIKTADLEVNGDIGCTGYVQGTVPVGAVIAWHKDLPNTPALPENFAECNGQTISDPDSPYNGQAVPDLNGEARFLRGGSTSGTEQNDTTRRPRSSDFSTNSDSHDHAVIHVSANWSASHTHNGPSGYLAQSPSDGENSGNGSTDTDSHSHSVTG